MQTSEQSTDSNQTTIAAKGYSPFNAADSTARPTIVNAPSASGVTIEDVTDTKTCSVCRCDRSVSEYSGAQLKKKGKRVCSICVGQKRVSEEKQQQAANDSKKAAAAASSKHVKPGASSSSSHHDECIVCRKSGPLVKHRCSHCRSHYCSIECMREHTKLDSVCLHSTSDGADR
jgi:hypothetical protein